ncbi:hypothetical protein P364_0122400 [Paenibacillus sp. MAEPY2]|nr:hypothetical protein P364_0122400 [Paenibacillus sp. MAEPY2]KGP86974.1 hypothetical protein P363_0115250 [Paenibacillus sp. MAEPY1]
MFQRREKERSCHFEGAQAAKGEEGAEGVTLASDFNRQERWKEEIGGQESNKALPPPERPRCTIKGSLLFFHQRLQNNYSEPYTHI